MDRSCFSVQNLRPRPPDSDIASVVYPPDFRTYRETQAMSPEYINTPDTGERRAIPTKNSIDAAFVEKAG
jgi:hypothetical protein